MLKLLSDDLTMNQKPYGLSEFIFNLECNEKKKKLAEYDGIHLQYQHSGVWGNRIAQVPGEPGLYSKSLDQKQRNIQQGMIAYLHPQVTKVWFLTRLEPGQGQHLEITLLPLDKGALF